MKPKSMAAVLEKPGKITLKEFPLPDIGPDEGLLKVEMVGICSTDIKVYQGKISTYPLPLIMGHEIVGRIARIGKRAAERWGVREDARVVLEASTSCGACEACLTGSYRFCKNPLGYGLKTSCDVPPHLWGGYSQYMYIAPGSVVFPIDDTVSLKTAALITGVLANSVQWVCLLGQLKVGDSILIQGMGVQGLSAIVAAREAGASKIFISGLGSDSDRFDLAYEFGADQVINIEKEDLPAVIHARTHDRGADLVLDVTGNPASIALALEAVRKQGTIVEAGLIGNNTRVPIILDRIMQKEIRLQGARSKGYTATSGAVSIAESGRYPLDKMVSAEFPLADCTDAFETAMGKKNLKPLKVMLIP